MHTAFFVQGSAAHHFHSPVSVPVFKLPFLVVAGHIVTVASVMALSAVAGLSAYCASKWAAMGFHESIRFGAFLECVLGVFLLLMLF